MTESPPKGPILQHCHVGVKDFNIQILEGDIQSVTTRISKTWFIFNLFFVCVSQVSLFKIKAVSDVGIKIKGIDELHLSSNQVPKLPAPTPFVFPIP